MTMQGNVTWLVDKWHDSLISDMTHWWCDRYGDMMTMQGTKKSSDFLGIPFALCLTFYVAFFPVKCFRKSGGPLWNSQKTAFCNVCYKESWNSCQLVGRTARAHSVTFALIHNFDTYAPNTEQTLRAMWWSSQSIGMSWIGMWWIGISIACLYSMSSIGDMLHALHASL